MKAEFKIGDTVHFRAYQYQPKAGLVATVKRVFRGGAIFRENDERVFYEISGPEVVSNTSGESIMESGLYEPPTE